MRKDKSSPKEKKNKRRSAFIAFFLTFSMVTLALLPLLSTEMVKQQYENVIEISMTDFSSSSKKAEDKAGAKKKAQSKKSVEKKVKPVKKAKPKPRTSPKAKPPVVVDKSKNTPVPTTPKPPKPAPVPAKPDPQPEVTETPTEDVLQDENTSASSESSTNAAGSSADNGKGKGDYGNDTDLGKKGNGKDGEDFTGTAIFSRKVIYRPDIKKIVKKQGKIAINLCVNREGRVVLVKWDKEKSTIRDIDNVRKTLEATKQYKFERDYSVPEQQCGKLTFIIDKN